MKRALPLTMPYLLLLAVITALSCSKQSNSYDEYLFRCGISSHHSSNHLLIEVARDGEWSDIVATLHQSLRASQKLETRKNCVLVPIDTPVDTMIQVSGISPDSTLGTIIDYNSLKKELINPVTLQKIEGVSTAQWQRCGFSSSKPGYKTSYLTNFDSFPLLGKHIQVASAANFTINELEISPLGCLRYPDLLSDLKVYSSEENNGDSDLFLTLDKNLLSLSEQSYQLCKDGERYDRTTGTCVGDEISVIIPRALETFDSSYDVTFQQGVLVDPIEVSLRSQNQNTVFSISSEKCNWLDIDPRTNTISGKTPFDSPLECNLNITATFGSGGKIDRNLSILIDPDNPPIWVKKPERLESRIYLGQSLFPVIFEADDSDSDNIEITHSIKGSNCDWITPSPYPIRDSIRFEGTTSTLSEATQCKIIVTAKTQQGRTIESSHIVKVDKEEICESFSDVVASLPSYEIKDFPLSSSFQTKVDSLGKIHILDSTSPNSFYLNTRQYSQWDKVIYRKKADEIPILVSSKWSSTPKVLLISKADGTLSFHSGSSVKYQFKLNSPPNLNDVWGVDSLEDKFGNILLVITKKDYIIDIYLEKTDLGYRASSGIFQHYDIESRPSLVQIDDTIHLALKRNHKIDHLLRIIPSNTGSWNINQSFGGCIESAPSIAVVQKNSLSILVNQNGSMVSYDYKNAEGRLKWQKSALLDIAGSGNPRYGNTQDELTNYIISPQGDQIKVYTLLSIDSLSIQTQLLEKRFNPTCYHSEEVGMLPARTRNFYDDLNFENNCLDDLINFYGQLCYAGYQPACKGVEVAQDDDGQWWRSPRQERFLPNNSITNTIVPGVALYFITEYNRANERDKESLRFSLKKWVTFIFEGQQYQDQQICKPFGNLRENHQANEWTLYVLAKLWSFMNMADMPLALERCTDYDQLRVINTSPSTNTISQLESSINSRLAPDTEGVMRLAYNGWKVHYFATINEVRKLVEDSEPATELIFEKIYHADPGNLLYKYYFIRDSQEETTTTFTDLQDELLKVCDLDFEQADRFNWRWERNSSNPGLGKNMMGWDCFFLEKLLEKHSTKTVISRDSMPRVAGYLCEYYELFMPGNDSAIRQLQRRGSVFKYDPGEFAIIYLGYLYTSRKLGAEELVRLSNKMILDKDLSNAEIALELEKAKTFFNAPFYDPLVFDGIKDEHMIFYLNQIMADYSKNRIPRLFHDNFSESEKQECVRLMLSEPYTTQTLNDYKRSLRGSYTLNGYRVVD
ncbi:hypothetical protein [Pseudobacteriovorax antillogorgiicola]|uniref:Uncharacterized protein n=1 Tax=Pseudobacteriovorax antillogorgiicola TaxID=1513793 RepID=A0A1Y6CIS4_9BACT|nr:hypothetical protein [Pseudobacteriovorax antillogorgiicola]TCS46735.1 hypothetical protein EDD56_123111 [Pseudobacteriovorax antillogorgiicola]SMF67277.1 hypothetical protein SAMN06296036_123111 [Pseudobacteriovorax antillogorgiicola]